MPRGKSGGAQANRTDLPGREPVTTAPSAEYGERAAQIAAQHAVPMGPPPAPGPAAGPAGAPQGAGGTPPVDLASLLAAAPPLAGRNGPLTRPTERPDEPVTHGLPVGAGGGPEVLSGVGALAASGQAQQGSVVTLLQHLASQPGSSTAMQDLASRAGSGAQ